MHISVIGNAKLALNWGTLHSVFLPSTQELLGSTFVPLMTTAVNRKWRGCFDACFGGGFCLFLFCLPTFPLLFCKVAGIVGRADLLCAVFFQLSFITYCKAFSRGRHPSINPLILHRCRTATTDSIHAN